MTLSRRHFILSTLAVASAGSRQATADEHEFGVLEQRHGGRLGVAALDTGSAQRLTFRGEERFPLCSTFKLLAAAAVLKNVDGGTERLNRVIRYGETDLLDYAPVTRANVAKGGMTVGDLCEAAMELSDNTAGNLLLTAIGGPAGLTRFTRALGDSVTRLDRNEPTLNTAIPGDPRDTTSPDAMLADLNALLMGNALTQASRGKLTNWLHNCKTAGKRTPAGLPPGWTSGNKTGSGDNGTVNDVAFIERPGAAPVLIAAYYTGSQAPAPERDGVLAEVGRIVARRFSAS